jgi:hypothetical protein
MKKRMSLDEVISLIIKTDEGRGKEIVYYPDEDKYSLISSAYKIRIITNVECLQSCFVDENNNIYELCKSIGGHKIWVECGKFNNRWKK